jgi:hypothetical protein
VALDIRPYRNTDAQALCDAFNAHYRAVGLPYALTALSLELCILSKPYFAPEHLLVAEDAGKLLGFIQIGFEPDEDLGTINQSRGVISALCVAPHETADESACRLLAAAQRTAAQLGAAQLRFCPPPPAAPYFAGLAPGDAMIGVPDLDTRQLAWLASSSWTAGDRVVYWSLELASFHPPIDRTQIQIRRMAHVDRLLDEPQLPWYIASVLGHTEQIAFQLTTRSTRTVAADVILWTVGQELLAQRDLVAHLWPLESQTCVQNEDLVVFLLAEAFRQLREDRIDEVSTIAGQEESAITRVLERVGFSPMFVGTVFTATL